MGDGAMCHYCRKYHCTCETDTQIAALPAERDALVAELARCQEIVVLDATDYAELKRERDALKAVLERLYPWLEAVNHVHLADGTLLYASEVWDVLQGAPNA